MGEVRICSGTLVLNTTCLHFASVVVYDTKGGLITQRRVRVRERESVMSCHVIVPPRGKEKPHPDLAFGKKEKRRQGNEVRSLECRKDDEEL